MCVFIQRIQMCDAKTGRHKKQLETCQTQRNSGSFAKPKKNSSNICQHNPKNRILPNFKSHKIDRWNLEGKLNSKLFACSTLDM